jgi:hypothetical protein
MIRAPSATNVNGSSCSAKGELGRLILGALRNADGEPLSSAQIVTAVFAAGDHVEPARAAFSPRVRGNLAYLQRRVKVLKSGRGKDVLWTLASGAVAPSPFPLASSAFISATSSTRASPTFSILWAFACCLSALSCILSALRRCALARSAQSSAFSTRSSSDFVITGMWGLSKVGNGDPQLDARKMSEALTTREPVASDGLSVLWRTTKMRILVLDLVAKALGVSVRCGGRPLGVRPYSSSYECSHQARADPPVRPH